MEDNIVAEWIGRLDRLDDHYDLVINIAKYFNAKIFPEVNIAGFVEYCSRTENWGMLEGDAALLEKEINPKGKRDHYKVGFRMSARKKLWCLRKLKDWLLEVKEKDPVTGVPIARTIDRILSPRILEEVINHNSNDNFDHISSLLGLMLLIGKLDGEDPIDLDEESGDTFEDYLEQQQIKEPKKRASILNY